MPGHRCEIFSYPDSSISGKLDCHLIPGLDLPLVEGPDSNHDVDVVAVEIVHRAEVRLDGPIEGLGRGVGTAGSEKKSSGTVKGTGV